MAIHMDVALVLCFRIVLGPKELANSIYTLEDMEDMKLNEMSTRSHSELVCAVSQTGCVFLRNGRNTDCIVL